MELLSLNMGSLSLNADQARMNAFAEFSESKENITSYSPFHQIRQMALESNNWNKLLKLADKEVMQNPEPIEDLNTSCLTNFCALNMLFIGKERAREIMRTLNFSFKCNFSLQYEKDGQLESINILIHNILSGDVVVSYNKMYKDRNYTLCDKSTNSEIKKLHDSGEYTKPYAKFSKKVVDIYYGKVDPFIYDHCRNVIDTLELEIEKNRSETTSDRSFIYHVAITMPEEEIALKGTQEQVEQCEMGFYHCFILEQYYSEEANRDFVRLHNSWIEEFSLADHYNNMRYGEQDEGCFSPDECKTFFANFRKMLSCQKLDISRLNELDQELQTAQASCFNISKYMPISSYFRKNAGIFTGLSVRYMSTKIDPKECLANIQGIKEQFGKVR